MLSCLLDVVYCVLGDMWHRIAWVRKKVKANRTLGFILSLLLLVCMALRWSCSATELGVCLKSVCAEKNHLLHPWTGISQKTMCLKVGDPVKWPFTPSLKGVKENSTVAKLEQWPGSSQNIWRWTQMFCIHGC